MPADVVREAEPGLGEVVEHPDMKLFFAKTGAEPTAGSPEAFQSLWLSEQRRWAAVIRANNIQIE